jgi:hypothetical protein
MTHFSTEVMAGQRLMVGFDGTDFNDDLKFLIGTLQVGGLILFSRNLGTPDQIRHLCRDCQSFAARFGLPPLFIAIDQEGGQVARLKPPFTQFPGNPAMKHPDRCHPFCAGYGQGTQASGNQYEHGAGAGHCPERRGQHHGRACLRQ